MDGLSLQEWHASGASVLVVRGELDYWTGVPLEEHLIGLAAAGYGRVVLDATGLRFCDAAGIRILVRGHTRARAQEGWLRLAGADRRLRRVLAVVKLTAVLPVFESVGDAVAGRLRQGDPQSGPSLNRVVGAHVPSSVHRAIFD